MSPPIEIAVICPGVVTDELWNMMTKFIIKRRNPKMEPKIMALFDIAKVSPIIFLFPTNLIKGIRAKGS